MSLDDFTDGNPADNAGPEDVVKNELTQWLSEHGASEVWWEKANPWHYPTFRTTGTDRPDLLVETAGGSVVAVETKHDASGVYRAPVQLQRYWLKHLAGDEEYRAGGERVEPDVFVLATGHSPDGHLYGTEYGDDHLQTWDSWGESKYPRERGWLPKLEYNATKSVVRVMWQYAAAAAESIGEKPDAGIGALLSAQLDDPTADSIQPRMLYYDDGKERWEGLL